MRTPTHTWPALTLALTLAVGAAAHGQRDSDAPPADPDEATGQGFPWLCFVTTVGALGGLYVFVRRRERAVEADPVTEPTWYCRACDRDVAGSACPYCGAANPFLDVLVSAAPGARRRRRRPVEDGD